MIKIKNKATQRTHRTDGNETRALLIQHAGIMFAKHGYQAISSKDICWAANVTPASVNYHFGSKEGLYHEVLMEAERVISSSACFEQLTSPSIPAKDALAGFLYNRFYDTIVHSGAWQYQLLIREAFMPSGVAEAFEEKVIRPRFIIMKEVIARYLGMVPKDPKVPEDPKVQEALIACLTVSSPWSMKPELLIKNLPAIYCCSAEEQAKRLTEFCMAGITTYIKRDAES
jgi:AcrR family transcriptional regulator